MIGQQTPERTPNPSRAVQEQSVFTVVWEALRHYGKIEASGVRLEFAVCVKLTKQGSCWTEVALIPWQQFQKEP